VIPGDDRDPTCAPARMTACAPDRVSPVISQRSIRSRRLNARRARPVGAWALVAGLFLAGAPAGVATAAPPSRFPSVEARLDLDAESASPFPADWFTVPDRAQRTGLRVSDRLARCVPARSACDDLRLLTELDGFDRPAPRDSLHGPDRRGERQPAQRFPRPARRGAARDHGPGAPRLGSGRPHALRTSRQPPRAGDALWARRDARPSRRGRPPGRAVRCVRGAHPVERGSAPGARAPGRLRSLASRARSARHPPRSGRGRLGLHHGERLGIPRAGA
jgi:hypothetical protein